MKSSTHLTESSKRVEDDHFDRRQGMWDTMEAKSRRAALMQLAALGTLSSAPSSRSAQSDIGAAPSPHEAQGRYIDCRDFAGLDPSGGNCSDGQINAAIAAGITNHLPVFLASGTYRIDNPLIGNPFAVKHNFANLQFYGAGGLGSLDPIGFPSRAHTVIAPTFRDRPAFALDLMSGAILRDFAIQGTNTAPNRIVMPIDRPAEYIESGCRNNRFSPYCAIVIDAFNNTDIKAEDKYPGMAGHYFLQGGGSAGITIQSVWISNFVVGIAYGISGLAANSEDLLFEDVWISRVDTGYAVGHSQSCHCMMQMGSLTEARQGIDGYSYGTTTGRPPEFHRLNLGYLYRVFTMPNTEGSFVMDNNYAESIRTIGNYGRGSSRARAPLSFIGGDYTITSKDRFGAAPPLFLETYSPTVFKGTSITRDANGVPIDALNVIAGDCVCSFEQCYITGTGAPNVPPFIGLVKDVSHVQCRLSDCFVASANGGDMQLSDDSARSYGIAPYAPGGRFSATYQSRHVTNGNLEYVFQPSAANNAEQPLPVSNLLFSKAGFGRVTFDTTATYVMPNDVLFWLIKPQGTSLLRWIVPALKVVRIQGAAVTCRLMFDPLEYASVEDWNANQSGRMFIAVRQWAPAQELTCSMNNSTVITSVSPDTILIGNGPEVAGDWVVGAGIPKNTRVVSVNKADSTAVLSQATTGGPASGVKLYFGRLYAAALTAAF